jgi:hypothetical protein
LRTTRLRSPAHLGGKRFRGYVLRSPRQVASAGEEAGDGNVFVELVPMKTESGKFDAFAHGRGRIEEARKPRERHADGAAVRQVDPHRMFVKADDLRGNGHAMLVG